MPNAATSLEQARNAAATAAWDASVQAIEQARATGLLRDMATAVDTWERMARLAGLSKAQRAATLGREVFGP